LALKSPQQIVKHLHKMHCIASYPSVSVDVEHYIHDKSFRHRLTLLSLRNSKIGKWTLTDFVFFGGLGEPQTQHMLQN